MERLLFVGKSQINETDRSLSLVAIPATGALRDIDGLSNSFKDCQKTDKRKPSSLAWNQSERDNPFPRRVLNGHLIDVKTSTTNESAMAGLRCQL